jgi:hypothetical protein
MYKKAEASFWTIKEIDLSRDTADWDKLSTPSNTSSPTSWPSSRPQTASSTKT